jgi:protein-cysteine N-palmitoyltransferase HHAT
MFIILILHPCLRRVYNAIFPIKDSSKSTPSQVNKPNDHVAPLSSSPAANIYLEQRLSFDLYFALVFLCALHGFSALKILLILYANFTLATRLPKSYVPCATWIFNIGILFANEFCRGYKFGAIAELLQPSPLDSKSKNHNNWGTFLDSYGGLIPRWEILFNLTVLRLISFNLDYYWSLDKGTASPLKVSPFPIQERPNPHSHRRNNSTHPLSLNETVSPSLPQRAPIHSGTTYPTPSTHPSISQAQY